MLDVAFISDLHLGHEAIAKVRGFENIEEYNNQIIERWNSVCGKKTLIFLAGDISMEKPVFYPLLDKMLGRKVIIGGNHDLREHTKLLLPHVESIIGALKYKGAIVTHIPIHTQEVTRFLFNIHGHTHEDSIKKLVYSPMNIKVKETLDSRYENISWDVLGGIPISFAQILEKRSKLSLIKKTI